MFCGTRFPLHRMTLAAGDSLFLYTDGLTEARNRAGEEYGLARVQKLAARHLGAEPRKLISECLTDLSGFREAVKQTDSRALSLIRQKRRAWRPPGSHTLY